jgi:hypothetical protein
MRGAREVCIAALFVTVMISWYSVNLDSEITSPAAEMRSRRAGALRGGEPRAGLAAPGGSGGAGGAAHASGHAATPPALADTAALDATGCPAGRRPYHVLMTAASGKYQEWQSRIAYYHYLKQKAAHPCSEMGGFTRLVNLLDGKPDALVAEMPSVVVTQLRGGHGEGTDYGFIVMNRPWGVMQVRRRARHGTGVGCVRVVRHGGVGGRGCERARCAAVRRACVRARGRRWRLYVCLSVLSLSRSMAASVDAGASARDRTRLALTRAPSVPPRCLALPRSARGARAPLSCCARRSGGRSRRSTCW